MQRPIRHNDHRARFVHPLLNAFLELTSRWSQRQASLVPSHGTYVGWLGKSGVAVAVVVRDRQVLAYVCNGASIAEWFSKDVSADAALELTSGRYTTLELQFTSKGVRGTFTRPLAKALPFHAMPVHGKAGLYRTQKVVSGVYYHGGWIVMPNGDQRGAVQSGRNVVGHPKLSLEQPWVQLVGGVTLEVEQVQSFRSRETVILPPPGTPTQAELEARQASRVLIEFPEAEEPQLEASTDQTYAGDSVFETLESKDLR
jgi:hypothetical protein